MFFVAIFLMACSGSNVDDSGMADGQDAGGDDQAALVGIWWYTWGDLFNDGDYCRAFSSTCTSCVRFEQDGGLIERRVDEDGDLDREVATDLAIQWGAGRFSATDARDDVAQLSATVDGQVWAVDLLASNWEDEASDRWAYASNGWVATLLPCPL